ncbi:MAG: RibD family protein, partial [Myxococcota bacterium]
VISKSAMTLDGRTATRQGESKWITGPESRREAHELRRKVDAVLVGVGTILADDPQLTVRLERTAPDDDPVRVVLDSTLRTPPDARVLCSSSQASTWIFHAEHRPPANQNPSENVDELMARRTALCSAGASISSASGAQGRVCLRSVMRILHRRGVRRLLVEGGSKVQGAFLDAALVDEVVLFIAPTVLGDAKALPVFDGNRSLPLKYAPQLSRVRLRTFGADISIAGVLNRSRE